MNSTETFKKNWIVWRAILLTLSMLTIFPIGAKVLNKSVDAEVRTLIEAQALQGIVWSTYDGDSLSIGATGLANELSGEAMLPDARLQVGSVTKVVLAIGVLRLITKGQLSLDDNVHNLLPELNWNNPWEQSAPLTVRHLLEHTGGLDNIQMWQLLNSQVDGNTDLYTAFPSSNSSLLKVRSRPGTQYSYSNMGYTLLGMLMEKVSGKRYETYMDEEILSPLGMKNSTFFYVHQSEDPNLAMGYFDGGEPTSTIPLLLRPAGQFTTTATDMGRFIEFLLNNGKLNEAQFVSPDLMASLSQPANTYASESGLRIGHGLALAKRDRHGVLGDCHPGTTFGFYAYLCIFPEQMKGYFFAINTDSESAKYDQFNQLFIRHLNVTEFEETKIQNHPSINPAYSGLYVMAPNNMAEFDWIDWMFNGVWLNAEKDSLIVSSLQNSPYDLSIEEKGLFRLDGRKQPSHVFYENEQGQFFSNGLITYKKVAAWPLVLSWLSLLAGLVALFVLLLRGTFILVTRQVGKRKDVMLPYLAMLAFVIPIALYRQQTYLQFGEMTLASMMLYLVSALLPLSLLSAVILQVKSKDRLNTDLLINLFALQFCILLMANDQLPVKFWG